MNTTFTNYAEKKAKQFFNLLQGYTKGIRITAILILLLMGVNNAWAYTAHFSLMGNPTPNGWTKDTDFMINTGTGTADEWYIYAYVSKNQYFALNNGSNQYGPTTANKEIKNGSGGGTGNYNSNAWKFVGSSGIIKICCAESNNREWYPYVWVEESAPTIKFKHPWNGGSSWSEQTATKQSDGTYTYDGQYGNKKAFNAGPSGKYKYNESQTTVEGSPSTGDMCRFIWNPVGYVQGGAETKASGTFKIVKLCSLTYNGNGNTGGTVPSATNNQLYNTSITLSSTTLTKNGYTHTGWNTKADGTGDHYDKGASYTLTAVSATLYAEWAENTYSVTISAGAGGTVSPSGSKTIGQVTKTTVTATPNANYEFVNWTATGGVIVANTTATSTTITATAAGTLTANFRSTATNSLTVEAGEGIASVTGSTNPVTLGNKYPITATLKAGYTFSTWTADPSANATFENASSTNTNVTVKNGAVTVTATATENTHDVTIRYLSGTTSIKEQTIESGVGEANATDITAPDITGYVFTSWTLGDGITNKSANTATSPISITTKAEGTYMLTANYQKAECVYFINTGRWTKVQIYAWLNSNNLDKNAEWPGEAMEKLNEKINGYEVYRYIRPADKNYDKLVFNNKTGNDGEQTSDLDWEDGKYYVYSAGQWVEREHVEDYLPNPVIYFKNHLGWENVYVYFFMSDNWDYGAITQGLTVENGRVCQMEKVGDTDIYKYDYSGSDFAPGNVIAFTKDLQPNYGKLHKTEAAYRSDYNPNMELYIPQKEVSNTDNETEYHNKGLWMRYNSQESGYSITGGFNNWNHNDDKFITGTPGSYQFTAEMALSAGETYNFKLKNIKNDWYSTGTSITANKANTAIEFITEHNADAQIQTETDGNYVFTVDLSEGKLMLTVKYAVEIGDYRIIYKDNADDNWSGHDKPANWYHPSRIIKKNNTDEATKDFVSFFINKDQSPELILQSCSAITNGVPQWAKVQDIRIPDEITEPGVYNFVLNQTEKGETKTVEYAGPYTGNYYIRCYAMNGGWNKYKTNSDNRMFYSAFSESSANSFGDKYSHYATKYCTGGTNIKFTIANDYSDCISDTLKTDIKITGNQVTVNPFQNTDDGLLKSAEKYNANIRFMWNRKTNKISRAYIGAASASNFLVLQGNKDFDDTNDKKSITFSDTQNWIYEINVKVHPDTRAKLYACYPKDKEVSEAQYFRGIYDTKANENWDNDNSAILLGGSGNTSYDMRVLYDFKTNRLMAALVPSGNINGEVTIDADVMIIREHQEDATCITLANDDSKLSNVKTVYGILRFNRLIINNRKDANNELPDNEKKTIYERALYFISFPFDVHLSDVFGFGTYGTHWVISDYNGKRRAERGYFADNCVNEDCTNWDYIWRPDTFTMKANTGYLLSLDLDLMQYDNTDFWKHGIEYVELFFPSETTLSTIQQTDYTMDALREEYRCTIDYSNLPGHTEDSDRRVKDSFWRCIGVPSFANYDGSLYDTTTDPEKKYPIEWKAEGETLPFLYRWNVSDNSLIVTNTSNYEFQSTFAYLVQNGNEIHWSAVNAKPSSPIVARQRSGEQESNYEWKITLTRGEVQEDQAFVRMTNHEDVTAEFDFGQDLSKELNYGRSDIYTLIGYERAAANSMPLSNLTTTVPLGLDIEQAGDYTIAMPEGVESVGVTLLDAETGERTNLSAGMDYTISLNKGVCHNRLYLEISPIQHTPTDIEYTDQSTRKQSVRKVLIDGQLYIVREGVVYDAQGHRL
ncbi:MAG: InlB B-repeat-containing protein [Paludibacteraceae bacterium]|nr:InlB B-repeat-containing protein [Paludibacteraceae bacterium]